MLLRVVVPRMIPCALRHAAGQPIRHGPVLSQMRFTHSFIDKAAHHGGRSLIGAFPSFAGRFDDVLKKVTIDKMEPGDVQVTFEVDEAMANGYGTLHGGFIATVVDVVGTLALISKDKDKAGVSLDLNVTYLNAAAIGERLIATGTILRIGNSYGFTEVEVYRESDKRPIAKGRHTKAFAPPKDQRKH